jgi:hypothetical protein
MRDKWDEILWESGTGYFDREATIEWREPRKDRVPPNPPPKKIGKVDSKTIALIAVSDLIDCGSWKTAAVMRFYIDTANRLNGNCWPSEGTVARKLGLRNTKVISRANRWWRRYGYEVGHQWIPFLRLARRGRRRPDGTKESNAYHVGWLPLIAVVAERHWNPKLRAEADAILHATLTHKVVNE